MFLNYYYVFNLLNGFSRLLSFLQNDDISVCLTPGCVRAASVVLDNLDESIQPCDDFFKFACGGFVKRTIIPDDKSHVTYFNIIGDRILEQVRLILEEPSPADELKPFAHLKKFYKLCVNKRAIEDGGLTKIKSLLDELGGFPVLEGDGWNGKQFDWKDMMYRFRQRGLSTNSLMNVFVGDDVLNSSQRILSIDQANLGLEREYLIQGIDNEVVKAYYEYLVDIAVILGAEKTNAEKEMKDALNLEIAIAQISWSREQRRNTTLLTNQMTIAEMQTRFPTIPWVEYFNNLSAVPNVAICPYDMVDVGIPVYVSALEKLLIETPKRVQANYLLYRTVINLATYLTKEFRDRYLKYSEVTNGVSEAEPRWRECTELTASKLSLAADALYVRRYFSEDAKRNAEELVANLKKTFTEMLKQVDWMDGNTKKRALEKAAAMAAYVGYPQELLDDKKLNEYYSKLDASTDNFMEFGMAIRKFHEDINFKELPEAVDKTDWTHHSFVTDVDAYYNTLENSIMLSAGILQSPLFTADRPYYMNYGSIGFAIGHEITHGFDDVGRQYGKDGTLEDWWADKTKEAFIEKAQCIIDQYGNFTAQEVNMHLNGKATQGENIADNGGVKEAYLAYNAWTKRNGEEPRLPGLNYSPRQLFWISTANLWCATHKTEYLQQLILTDAHSPPNFRVNGPLGNTEFFSKDFGCPLDSGMNPVHKCQVW